MHVPLIYKEADHLGIDIGNTSVKAVQLEVGRRGHQVIGYGYADFPADTIVEGIIADPKLLAAKIQKLLQQPLAGKLKARRVVLSLPSAKIFIRTLQLPPMTADDLAQAVRYEAEQYVPVPLNDLYIDYEAIGPSEIEQGDHQDVLMVAAPRAIVDSYINLFDRLSMPIHAIESSLQAISRVVLNSRPHQSTLVMDFNSRSSDMAVINDAMRLTGSVAIGGGDLTKALVTTLGITPDQATEIKFKFGLGPSGMQPKIMESIEPKLKTIVAEIKKLVKYYNERGEHAEDIQTILLSGGSAALPGLVDYLYSALKLPIIVADPWIKLDLHSLRRPDKLLAPIYTTAIGLAWRGTHD